MLAVKFILQSLIVYKPYSCDNVVIFGTPILIFGNRNQFCRLSGNFGKHQTDFCSPLNIFQEMANSTVNVEIRLDKLQLRCSCLHTKLRLELFGGNQNSETWNLDNGTMNAHKNESGTIWG